MAYEFLDNNIGILLKWDPFYGLLILTFILTFATTVVYKYTSNQAELKRLKEESAVIQKELKENKNNPEKMMELQKRQLQNVFMESFKHNLKPMILTLVPLGILFFYLGNYYKAIGNPKLIIGLSWIWVYIISSLISNMILRKTLKVY